MQGIKKRGLFGLWFWELEKPKIAFGKSLPQAALHLGEETEGEERVCKENQAMHRQPHLQQPTHLVGNTVL